MTGGINFRIFISSSLSPFPSRMLPLNDGCALYFAFLCDEFAIIINDQMYPIYFAVPT